MLYPQGELDQARRNRERVKEGYGNDFYNQQDHICAGWEEGKLPPKGLILGELPCIYAHSIKDKSRVWDS